MSMPPTNGQPPSPGNYPGPPPGPGYQTEPVLPYYGNRPPQPEHPQGTTVLVLGILSLVVCSLFGPFAWYMGSNARKEVQASPTGYSNSGLITAGWVMGIVSSVLLIAGIAFFIVMFIVLAAAGASG